MRIRDKYCNSAATDALLQEEMKRFQIPGLTIAMIHGGDIIYSRALGIKNEAGDPMDQNTLFEAASLTKSLFALITLQMAQRGELDIDRPIMDVLHDTPWSEDPRFTTITPRQCLCHVCGLPDWEAKPMHMLFDPGEQYSYSGEGYLLTQRMVEQITGKDLNELLHDCILEQLHMENSTATWTSEVGAHFSVGFGQNREVVKIRNARRTTGNAPEPCAAWSLYSNAFDMVNFLKYIMDRHGDLDDKWFAEMCAPQVVAAQGIQWGLGWGLCAEDPEVLWHWGDNDGFKSLSILDRKSGDALSIFTNSDNGFAFWEDLLRKMTDAVFVDDMVEFVRNAE